MMMKYYETVSEAINDLYKKGYTTDFSLLTEEDCIYCHKNNHSLKADEFEIDEIHRFEGNTDPGDEMILYAVSSKINDIKGVLLNAYGMYADSNNSKIVEKLNYGKKKIHAPIKRAEELIPLSREHHHGLLLGWKIKQGMAKKIALQRIKTYADWFYRQHLSPHFDLEEKYVFPLLGETNEQIIKAKQQHRQIRDIIEKPGAEEQDLVQLEKLLTEHIRFEERILFNEIQKSDGLKSIMEFTHAAEKVFIDNETDPFWK